MVLCLTLSAVWAQSGLDTARSIGMGGAVIGVADDAAAWYQNPAGLGLMKSTNSMIPLASDLMGTWLSNDLGSDTADGLALTWSGALTGRGMGIGAGFSDVDYVGKTYGAGFGMALKSGWLSWGAKVVRFDPDSSMSGAAAFPSSSSKETVFGVGAMAQFPQLHSDPIRVGVVVEDVFDATDNGPYVNVGAYWPVLKSLGIALDLQDVTDQSDEGPFVNAGVEYKIGLLGNWTVRAGMMDNGSKRDFTAGLGFSLLKWRVDAAYSAANDGLWALSGAWQF